MWRIAQAKRGTAFADTSTLTISSVESGGALPKTLPVLKIFFRPTVPRKIIARPAAAD